MEKEEIISYYTKLKREANILAEEMSIDPTNADVYLELKDIQIKIKIIRNQLKQ